jgi:tetratricopeptide (TPR) repeat protein
MTDEQYFASAEDALPFVVDDFPFPLAVTYTRLQQELIGQEPIATAWALRDAFECLLKFTASLAVADFLQADPPRNEAGQFAELLLTPQGLSLGHWHRMLEVALRPQADKLSEGSRRLPELQGVFFKSGRKRSALNHKINGSEDSFTAWRNRVFGHGVFRQERAWYAQQTLDWLPTLHEFYLALQPVLNGWRLVARSPAGEAVDWQGAEEPRQATPHEYLPWGEPVPMHFVPASRLGRLDLPLGPLLSVHRCPICGQPAAFFFDRHRYDREKDRHRTYFLEYFRGHQRDQHDWAEAKRIHGLLPQCFVWERTSYDQEDVIEGVRIAFRDFETDYFRPDYLLDAVWQQVAESAKGYLHLVGRGGMGKSYLMRGLAADGAQRGVPVLAYHIQPGASTDYRTLVSELADRARENPHLRLRTQEVQTADASPAAIQGQFIDFCRSLIQDNLVESLVVAIDALDELTDPPTDTPSITDFLPSADQLPKGCFVVLTSRPELHSRARAKVEQIARSHYTRLGLEPEDERNRQLLRAYLVRNLPETFREPAHVDEVLTQSGGIFLYADHLCRALSSGVFTETKFLPKAEAFYPAYLTRLKNRVGEYLYDTVYLQTLLYLSAARQPVTREQLEHWGIPRDRLRVAITDFADFLRIHRIRRWHESLTEEGNHRYDIAHEGFIRFVSHDPVLSVRLRDAHAHIGRYALALLESRWDSIDPTDDIQLYSLRNALEHLEQGDDMQATESLRQSTPYAKACAKVGDIALKNARYWLALASYSRATNILGGLVSKGHMSLASHLVRALTAKGIALASVGRLGEALNAYEDATEIVCRIQGEQGLLDFSSVLVNKGNALAILGRLPDAIASYEEAISIRGQFTRADEEEYLAIALMNKGIALANIGRIEDAINAHGEAIVIRRRLVEEQGRVDLANDLARALKNKGNALAVLGQLEDAIDAFDEAIGILRGPVDGQIRTELASVLINQSNTFQQLGQLAKAIATYDEAIGILRPLVDNGREELANDLAQALMNKGNALTNLCCPQDALGAYDDAIEIQYFQVTQRKRMELNKDLARSLMNKGIALAELDRLAQAIEAYDKAIGILRPLVDEGHIELINELARALNNKGNALRQLGRLTEALSACDEGILLRYRLVKEQRRTELTHELGRALVTKAIVLGMAGCSVEAIGTFDEAVSILRGAVNQGRVDLANELAGALMNKGNAYRQLDQLAEAMTAYAEAIQIWQQLIKSGMLHLTPNLLKALSNRIGLHCRMDNIDAAALDTNLVCSTLILARKTNGSDPALASATQGFIKVLQDLKPNQQFRLLQALGDDAEVVRKMLQQ